LGKTGKASYLVAYRYSTLKLFNTLGINIGTAAVPQYQDLNFKINIPAGKKGNVSIFGIGGNSRIDILVSEYKKENVELYGDQDRDQRFGTTMGTGGLSYSRSLNANTYIKLTVAGTYAGADAGHDLVKRNADFSIDTLFRIMNYDFKESKIASHLLINSKLNNSSSIKAGVVMNHYFFNFKDSVMNFISNKFMTRMDYDGNAAMLHPYFQWKKKMGEKWVVNMGVTGEYFTINRNSIAIEPRAGIRFNLLPGQWISLGAGMHSQAQPTYTYFQRDASGSLHNLGMGLTRSNHIVLGYDYFIREDLRLKGEAYYQTLNNIPVEAAGGSFSMVNQGSGFSRFFPRKLVNSGTAENYGVELTVEKFYSNRYFLLSTLSVFQSKYKGSDDKVRNSDFNGNYVFNIVSGKDFNIGESSILTSGIKLTAAGGRRFSPIDTAQSRITNDEVIIDSLRNSMQLRDYFRFDLSLKYRIEGKKTSHEIALDLVNVFDIKNVLGLIYAPDPTDPASNPIREQYQLGRLPLFYYRIDF
jgi:hypothetical protein